MKVVIIEDEPLAQDELKRLILKNFQQFYIVAVLDSVEESVTWFKKHSCDLVFMDIQLSDGKSFEIFEDIQLNTPIIFTTAYDAYAIKAFQVNSIGYVLKPIDEEDLVQAINKYLQLDLSFEQPKIPYKSLLAQFEKPNYKQRFLVKNGPHYLSVNIDDIAYFYSEDKVTFAQTYQGKAYILDLSLDQIEKQVNPTQFFRITRNILTAFDAVKQTSKYHNSRLYLKLKPEFKTKVLVSRVKVSEFLNWLDS